MDNYLVLNEKRNAVDFLLQSLSFLSQISQNKFYLKWFIIAFHGAVHSFMILALQSIDSNQIYKKLPDHLSGEKPTNEDFSPFDGLLVDFKDAYKKLKNPEKMNQLPFKSTDLQDRAVIELNDKLRNHMVHFKPMTWGSEPWYPARVCLPLLEILRFCISLEKSVISGSEREMAHAYINSLQLLLDQYAEKQDAS